MAAPADLQALAQEMERELGSGDLASRSDVHDAKLRAARRLGLRDLPPDPDWTPFLAPESHRRWAAILRTKPTRSQSGVAVVAVMSSPAACPHGRCTFCPGGPAAGVPQSYTGFEPSTMRAIAHGYDPYRIVRGRLAQLERNGHAIDKVDVVVQGGTFPAREPHYQDWFVAGIYAGLNAGPDALGHGGSAAIATATTDSKGDAGGPEAKAGEAADCADDTDYALARRAAASSAKSAAGLAGAPANPSPSLQSIVSLGGVAFLGSEDEWASLPPQERRARLDALMAANESARCRCIGLTVETKPDWCLEEHLDRMLSYGATRVEVGVQTLDEGTLRLTHRGHTVEDSRRAVQLARDAGFKVCAHVMPGLPRPPRGGGQAIDPDPAMDRDDFRRLFADEDWRPDMLKVYPTLVVQEGDTPLGRQWAQGLYHPYGSAQAAAVVGEGKGHVPEWCRIQRIDRDIPTTHVLAGVLQSNLRQLAQAWRAGQGLPPCRCLRCREAGTRAREGKAPDPDRLVSVRRDYAAGGGTEAFLAFEDPEVDAVAGYLRLRRVSPAAHRPETQVPGGAAFVRELKVPGVARRLGDGDPEAGSYQHQGLGGRLLEWAERVAFEDWGAGRLLIIVGPGVKAYYLRRGYTGLGPYVAKGKPAAPV